MVRAPFGLFLALCAAEVSAQQSSATALDAIIKRNTELHARAQQAVQAEDERGRKELCPDAKSTMEINTCYAGELSTAEANEVKLVRAIGGMLRAGTEPSGTPPMRLSFDQAEATWHTYREQACHAAGNMKAARYALPLSWAARSQSPATTWTNSGQSTPTWERTESGKHNHFIVAASRGARRVCILQRTRSLSAPHSCRGKPRTGTE